MPSFKRAFRLASLAAVTLSFAIFGSSLQKTTHALPYDSRNEGVGLDQSKALRKEVVEPEIIVHDNSLLHHYETGSDTSDRPAELPHGQLHADSDGQEELWYGLTAFGQTFALHLQRKGMKRVMPSEAVHGPLVIEVNASSDVTHSYVADVVDCTYTGKVDGDEESYALIDTCRGELSGFIFMKGSHYIIEPVSNHSTGGHESKPHGSRRLRPHVIYAMPLEPPAKQQSTLEDKVLLGPPLYNMQNDRLRHAVPPKMMIGSRPSHSGHRLEAEVIPRRRARSVSKERHVETMVVVDKTVVDYHGKESVQHYVVALMKSVMSIYQDESLGNLVNIHLTKIVVLVDDQPNLTVVHDADKTLDSFCLWQVQLRKNQLKNVGSSDHDVAILLTRVDICSHSDEPCGTIGLAPVAGMCQPERSCSIIEDIGLGTAFIIAHEMGHMFSIPHDGVGNECGSEGHDSARLMAMHMTLSKDLFTWSNCSRYYITTFLDSGRGSCLDNKPNSLDLAVRKPLPGEVYSADEQCKYQFHDESTVCKERDICRELWCTTPEGFCLTNGFPAGDGTRCRTRRVKNGWCVQGRCIEHGKQPQPVEGGWGSWSAWGRCSRTCGGGIASSHRNCDNPRPQHGGRYCLGERSRYASCNVDDCPANSTELRAIQCTQTNTSPFRGEYYQWVPFQAPNVNPCSLYCMASGYNFYTERSSKVIDGTPCQTDFPYGTCVNGECMKVGCDRVIGSTAADDQCRVCKGNNSSCRVHTGTYAVPYRESGYHQILRLAKGTTNIRIEEVSFSNNYLAIRNRIGTYYLNGVFTIDWPRKIYAAGTVFNYVRNDNQPEELTCSGPIEEELHIMVLFQGFNPGIKWQYSSPLDNTTEDEVAATADSTLVLHEWSSGNWSECSTSCAGGQQVAHPQCVRSLDGLKAADSLCDAEQKPEARHQICNLQPCPASWTVGRWSECSQDCGSGKRYRQVVCMQKTSQATSEVVDDSHCLLPRPPSEEGCKEASCPTVWRLGNWTLCSVTCGRGWQSREVTCTSVPSGKATLTVLQPQQVTLPDGQCRHTQKPATRQACSVGKAECPQTAMWVTGEWSKCTVTCGTGVQSRVVMCTTNDGKVSTHCDSSARPVSVQDCSSALSDCQSSAGATTVNGRASVTTMTTTTRLPQPACNDDPKVSYCPLVKELSFCSRPFFRELCCKTCTSVP